LNNPAKANELVLRLVKEYNTGWVYSAGLASYAIDKVRSEPTGRTRPWATSTPPGCSG
jgi:hypothetical protein